MVTKPLVIFSTQGWTDLWVSKHWIAHQFSKDRVVLFVEPPLRLTPSKFISGELFEGKIEKVQDNLYKLATVTFPFPFRIPSILRPFWRYPIARQFGQAMLDLGFEEFDVLNFDPHSMSLINRYKERITTSVYYAVDPPLGKEDRFWPESRCVKESDFVFAVTPTLKDLMVSESGRDDIEILPHGVDYEGSQTSDEDVSELFRCASDRISKNDVVIGYTGAIHDVCIDQDVVLQAIRKRPNWKFVFVGPYQGSTLSKKGLDISSFRQYENVIFTGAVPYLNLKYFIKRFDVCIVPYNHRVDVNWDRRSPFKVLGYLAQGKPVVISDVPAAKNYNEHVYVYDDLDGFLKSCEAALDSDSENEARKKFAADHDFAILKRRLTSKLDGSR